MEPLKLYRVRYDKKSSYVPGGKEFFFLAVSDEEAWELVGHHISVSYHVGNPKDHATVVQIPEKEGFFGFDL